MASRILTACIISILFISCSKKQALIQNPERQTDIRRMLAVQKELTSKSQTPIWDIFDQKLSPEEKQALEFIYAYAPLSDLAGYQPEFFLKNVQYSLKARVEMPWGKNYSGERIPTFRAAFACEQREPR